MTDVLNRRWRRSPDAYFNSVGDEVVLLHVKRGVYYGLDSMGARFWAALETGRELRELCGEIAQEYGVPVDQVESDARDFVEDLAANEIVVEE